MKHVFKFGLIAAAAALLAACGGDATVTGVPAAPITVAGTAATGAPIANAPVSIQCKSIDAPDTNPLNTTTNATGDFTKTFTGVGPCVVSVTSGGVTYQSITKNTSGVTTSLIANVNPLSDLVVKSLAAAKGTTNLAALVSTNLPSDADIDNAATKVLDTLKTALGAANVPNIDILDTAMTATNGNTYDDFLELLKTAAGQNIITSTGTIKTTVVTAAETAVKTVVAKTTGAN
jgi:hypothetical protein